jgi:signal transduction histidine kinase
MKDSPLVAGTPLRTLELDVAREVAHAFITATSPLEVYRLALARLTPLVRASFSSVFERDPADPGLLKLACAHNWPQASARFLSQLRVRVGRGPTGRAVAEAAPCEVRDVFADPALREWWDPARELGFTSLISLPLRTASEATGALTFYFDAPHDFADDERHLLMLIADQLAAVGGRAAAAESQRREMQRLRAENQMLRGRLDAGEETRRLRDEFLSNISHELRTPLNAILGYAALLASGQLQEGEEQGAAIARIEASANMLLRLINDLLALTELKLGRVEVSPAAADAAVLARHAVEAAGPPPEGVTLRVDAAADRIPVTTDGEKVLQVLHNLLSNAYKFTAQGSVTVGVRALTEGDESLVEWSVADSGVGIPPEALEAVFDEFRQVDGSSTRLYGGTGLGLALSRALARLLGGRITVESRPGAGSTFRLLLPAQHG